MVEPEQVVKNCSDSAQKGHTGHWSGEGAVWAITLAATKKPPGSKCEGSALRIGLLFFMS